MPWGSYTQLQENNHYTQRRNKLQNWGVGIVQPQTVWVQSTKHRAERAENRPYRFNTAAPKTVLECLSQRWWRRQKLLNPIKGIRASARVGIAQHSIMSCQEYSAELRLRHVIRKRGSQERKEYPGKAMKQCGDAAPRAGSFRESISSRKRNLKGHFWKNFKG